MLTVWKLVITASFPGRLIQICGLWFPELAWIRLKLLSESFCHFVFNLYQMVIEQSIFVIVPSEAENNWCRNRCIYLCVCCLFSSIRWVIGMILVSERCRILIPAWTSHHTWTLYIRGWTPHDSKQKHICTV